MRLSRRRIDDPAASRRAARRAEWAVPVTGGLVVLGALATVSPWLPGGVQRIWLVGATLGFLTGLPFAAERRSLRRRLAAMSAPADPLATEPYGGPEHAAAANSLRQGDPEAAVRDLEPVLERQPDDVEALRLRALAAVASGDPGAGRLYALRAVQVDASRWDIATDAGVVLCRAGSTRDGLRLLEKATLLAPRSTAAWLALAWGFTVAGRLRDAATALDVAQGRPGGLPRRPGPSGGR